MFIGMIWRPTPDRTDAFNQARAFWDQLGPVRFFDSGHPAFNRAASRNLAVKAAENAGETKAVITDADCVPDRLAVLDAYSKADDDYIHLPYTVCNVHGIDGTVLGQFDYTRGGVYVTTTKAWWGLGGQDERFTKWAPEDFAFSIAHQTLYGRPFERHTGFLQSLGHLKDPNRHEESEDDPLVQLYRRYEAACGDREAMEALCFPWS